MKNIKKFYVDNMKLIHKFLIFQVAMALFGFTVILSASAFGETAALAATTGASVFFLALLYDSAWEEGARDRNRIINGRLKKRPLHGAYVALFAYIPTYVFVLPCAVLTVLLLCGTSLPDFFGSVLTVCKSILIFFCHGMYLGFTSCFADLSPNGFPLFFLLYPLPAMVAYGFGYFLGAEDKQIKTVFGMKPSTGGPAGPKRK